MFLQNIFCHFMKSRFYCSYTIATISVSKVMNLTAPSVLGN